VDTFVDFTKSSEVPYIFRKWIAIGMVSSCLGRKVWTTTTNPNAPFHPNLYILLVGEPGVGKTLPLGTARDIMEQVPGVNLGPDQITPESLAEEMAELNGKPERDDWEEDPALEPAELALFLNEFGNFVKADSKNFIDHITFLSGMYDCPRRFDKKTKTAGDDFIYQPCLNIVAGTQPAWFATAFNQMSLGQGFPARLMLIYSKDKRKRRPFQDFPNAERLTGQLVNRLEKVTHLSGYYEWSDEAKEYYGDLYMDDVPPVPSEPLLRHYNERRGFYLAKLSMIAAASDDAKQQIEKRHVETAYEWITEAEVDMHKALISAGGNRDRGIEAQFMSALLEQGKMRKSEAKRVLDKLVDTWRINGILDGLREQEKIKEDGRFYVPGPGAKHDA
jgi:hypothetical protein